MAGLAGLGWAGLGWAGGCPSVTHAAAAQQLEAASHDCPHSLHRPRAGPQQPGYRNHRNHITGNFYKDAMIKHQPSSPPGEWTLPRM